MPTAALHSNYWAGSADAPPDPPETGIANVVSYPHWQTTVTVGSGFGVSQVVWEWLVARAKARAKD